MSLKGLEGLYRDIYRHIGFRVSQDRGTFRGGPYSKDCSVWGPIFGCPYVGKTPKFTDNIQLILGI